MKCDCRYHHHRIYRRCRTHVISVQAAADNRPTMTVAVYDVVVVVIAAAVALTAALLFTIHKRLGTDQHHNDHKQANA